METREQKIERLKQRKKHIENVLDCYGTVINTLGFIEELKSLEQELKELENGN